MQRLEDTASTFNVLVAMLAYSACSSSLLLANKVSPSLPSRAPVV